MASCVIIVMHSGDSSRPSVHMASCVIIASAAVPPALKSSFRAKNEIAQTREAIPAFHAVGPHLCGLSNSWLSCCRPTPVRVPGAFMRGLADEGFPVPFHLDESTSLVSQEG